MCDPVSWTIGISAVLGGATQLKAQSEARQIGKEQAKDTARSATLAARDAKQRGALAELDARRRWAAAASTRRAELAASGADLGTGSAADELVGLAGITAEDVLRIQENTKREVRAIKQQARGAARSSSLDLMRLEFASIGTVIETGGAVAGTAFGAYRPRATEPKSPSSGLGATSPTGPNSFGLTHTSPPRY